MTATPLTTTLPDRKEPYYSAHQCDCGCGQYLPQRNFDLGWRFQRGHKPVGVKITKTKTLGHRAPRTEAGATCNWALIEKFVGEALALKEQRFATLGVEIPAMEAQLDALRAERSTLETEIYVKREALAQLLPAKKEEK